MPKDRILIVDDDETLRCLCGAVLRRHGYQVEFATTLAKAAAAIRQQAFHLVLLDLNLPDGDGLEFGRRLQVMEIPFLIMTVRSQPEERLTGFTSGAVDYLIKPFHVDELIYRVRRIAARHKGEGVAGRRGGRRRVGTWLLDLDRQMLEGADGRLVELTNGEFKLLAALVAANGRVVSRDRLLEIVAREEGEGHYRTVDVLVSRLRKKMNDARRPPGLIITVVGVGYRLAAVAEAAAEPS